MRMFGKVIFGLCVLILASCSTLIHKKTVRVNIYTDVDSALVCLKDNDDCYVTPATIDLLRSKSDVELIIKKDTLIENITLDSRLSAGFWFGNMISGAGIAGYAIDLTNPKRFTYPKYNYVSLIGDNEFENKRASKLRKWIPPVKNQLNFKLSIPEGNYFYLNKGSGYGNTFGFLGLSVGVEYYLSNLHSINTDIGIMMDFMLPFPAPIDIEGNYNAASAIYLDLQIGRDVNAFHFDIGAQGNKTSYQKHELVGIYPLNIDLLKYTVEQYNAGFAFSCYYKITNRFNLGVNYHPSFLAWNNGRFNMHYSHLFMFELMFKIIAHRPKKEKAGYRMQYQK